ncbi:hypothetical protein AB0F11_15565 [Streptomyces sp. NPDC032472]|uniref:hypothetical protein n=1 Tax=Streptomyces sp. NPDC032472 TaxID=3155018 RepID=UPI0033E87697
MITARSSLRAPRIRGFRNPVAAFWLALLFFGFLYAHGAGAGVAAGTAHHFSAAPAVEVSAAAFPGGTSAAVAVSTPGEDGSPHPVEHCVPGRPDLDAVTADCPRADGHRGVECPPVGGVPAPRGAPQTYGVAVCPTPGVLRI